MGRRVVLRCPVCGRLAAPHKFRGGYKAEGYEQVFEGKRSIVYNPLGADTVKEEWLHFFNDVLRTVDNVRDFLGKIDPKDERIKRLEAEINELRSKGAGLLMRSHNCFAAPACTARGVSARPGLVDRQVIDIRGKYGQ